MAAQQQTLYENVLSECFQKIQRVHNQSNAQYTFYTVPLAISGEPMYEWVGCVSHVKKALRENGFAVRLHVDRRTLFISWDEAAEQDTEHQVEKKAGSEIAPSTGMTNAGDEDGRGSDLVINFDPRDPLSHVNLRAQLMAANGRYAHLKTVQTMRRK
jgi:hypothetical protein